MKVNIFKNAKRILNVVLAFAMIITIFPMNNMKLNAAEPQLVTTWSELKSAIGNGGQIKLSNDITAGDSDSDISVNKTVTIDLNGYKIDRNKATATSENYSVFIVYTDGNLTIKDSTAASTTGTSTGGMITGSHSSNRGLAAAVYMYGGTVTLESGKITGNTGNLDAAHCAAVYIYGGTFNLKNGSICGNTACWGGGVFIYSGVLNMSGGSITGNTAEKGGGGIEIETDNSIFNMSGGSITGNTVTYTNGEPIAMHKGGGVHFYKGTINLSGNATISDNTCAGQTSNIYRRNQTNIFTVSELASTAKFGIYTENKEKSTSNEISIEGITSDNAKYFFNDITSANCSYINGTLDIRSASATPTIETQPLNQSVLAGTNATFSVAATASDSGSLSYQWEKQTSVAADWSEVSGANSTSYTVSSSTKAMNGDKYRCKVTNDKGTEYITTTYASDAATLTVHSHNWQYTADGAVLTAKCIGENDCAVENGKTNGVSLTLTPTSPTYSGIGVTPGWKTGQTINFTLDGQTQWESILGSSSTPAIYYEGTGSTTYEKSTTKPTQAGTYKATISKDEATASLNFVIKQVYQVSFNANGGYGTMSSIEVFPGNFTLPLCTIKPPMNKEFDGWALTASGSKISTLTTYVSGNTTLYAKWKEHTHQITTTVLSGGIKKQSCDCGFYIINFD